MPLELWLFLFLSCSCSGSSSGPPPHTSGLPLCRCRVVVLASAIFLLPFPAETRGAIWPGTKFDSKMSLLSSHGIFFHNFDFIFLPSSARSCPGSRNFFREAETMKRILATTPPTFGPLSCPKRSNFSIFRSHHSSIVKWLQVPLTNLLHLQQSRPGG